MLRRGHHTGRDLRSSRCGSRPDRIFALAADLSEKTPPWRDRTAVDAAVRASITALLESQSSDHAVLVATANERAARLYRSAGYQEEDLRLTKILDL